MKIIKTLGYATLASLLVFGVSFSAHAESGDIKINGDLNSVRGSGEVRAEVNLRGGLDDGPNHDANDDRDNGQDRRNDDYRNDVEHRATVGTIIAINGSTLTVKSMQGTVYTVNTTNAQISRNGGTIAATNLAVNDMVIIKGSINGNTVTATSVISGNWKDKFPSGDDWKNLKPGIMGTVTAVSGSTLSVRAVNGTTYSVETANAKFQKEKNTAITISNIAVGDSVIIQGTVNGTTVTATNVFDVEAYVQKAEDRFKPDVSGVVTAVNGSTITVRTENGTVYTVDGAHAKLRTTRDESVSSKYTWSNIQVGHTVWIKGTVNGTTVTATSVVDTDLAISQAMADHPKFFKRIGNWFRKAFMNR
jgi:hypothetical protein